MHYLFAWLALMLIAANDSAMTFQEVQLNTSVAQTNLSAVKINHHVKGRDVYIECIIPGFTFNRSGSGRKDGEGHIHVYLNGKKLKEEHKAAFVLKELPIGKHEIKLKFVHHDHTPYNYSKRFSVEIH